MFGFGFRLHHSIKRRRKVIFLMDHSLPAQSVVLQNAMGFVESNYFVRYAMQHDFTKHYF